MEMPASGWAEFFSGGHGGRPYFVHAETGATQWAEPSSYRLEQEAIDAAVFGVDIELVRGVMAPLRTMQGDAAHWPDARALLLRVTGNVASQPHAEKFRSLKTTPGGKFAATVCSSPGGCELMRAMGFVESSGALTLPPDAPTDPCRLAHCHIERSTKVTGDDVKDDGGSGGGGGSGRWSNHACSACACVINSGQERLWTGRWDAPRGEFRYQCTQCAAPKYTLCEVR